MGDNISIHAGRGIWSLAVLDDRLLGVAGERNDDTFVDLYKIPNDTNSQEKLLLKNSKPYYSKIFTNSSNRCVCFLDDHLFATCCEDRIELYNSNDGSLVKRQYFSGHPWCMTTGHKLLFVGIRGSGSVIVFDAHLNQTKTISLGGLRESHGDCPIDIAVSNNKVLIATVFGKALMYNDEGELQREFKTSLHEKTEAMSLAVSEETGFIFILWGRHADSMRCDVHSLSEGHILAAIDLPYKIWKMRINNEANRMFAVDQKTDKVYEFHTRELFSYENLSVTLETLTEKDDCQKLLDHFNCSANKSKSILESFAPISSLLGHLRENGVLSSEDISPLVTACSQTGLRNLVAGLEFYECYGNFTTPGAEGQKLEYALKKTEQERQRGNESGREDVQNRLTTTEEENQSLLSKLKALENRLKKVEDEKKQLTETLAGKDHQNQVTPASVTKKKTLSQEKETPDVSQESVLQAEFGRLLVGIAEDLTLDNTLRLAALFRLSPAQTDQLRRVSLVETPGITLLNVIKTQNIINMYDVTNLQKGLLCIQLNRTNGNLLVPYQAKIGQFQFEENQAPKLLDWPDKTFISVDEATISEESTEREETEEHPEHDEELPRTRKDSQIHHIRRSHSYMEHKINCDSGTMSVMGIYLTIPKDALSNDHVVSVKVIHHYDVSLPVIACGSRMTPVIQLEPEGLTFNKPARLTVPHSALISETDCQRVIVFAGRKHEEYLQTGEITWNEEETTDCKLDREKISFDINILSYIFVTLVSQETEQKHIFRVVSFIDGILDAKEDALITVCFSKDSEEDYKMLLEDYSSKLSLGNYKTIQITRTLGGDKDETSHIELMLFSKSDNYHLTKEESSKHVEIDHLCAASRVSYQFRLKRNPDVDNDMVDVRLKVSQTEENELTVFLQTKVKNILLSPTSQKMLFRESYSDLHAYEKLKAELSQLLDKQHCEKLGGRFKLKPEDQHIIQTAEEPGKMLMKILDETELIKPDKMIDLYEGLKAIHLNKVAKVALEYIDMSTRKHAKEGEQYNENSDVISKREFQSTRSFKILQEEEYATLDIQRALKLSFGKLDLARRILLLAKEAHEGFPLFPRSTLYKEQYIDQHGGEMDIAGLHLVVPANALHTGRIISLWVSNDPAINGPILKKSLRLSPVVKFGPERLTLHKPVSLSIPHCAFTSSIQTGIDVYSGVLQTDQSVKWSPEKKHLSCSMTTNHLEVEAQKPCLIGLHVPYIPKMKKRVCVLPIVNISNMGDQFTLHFWFHNDEKLEHESIIHEEVYKNKGLAVHRPVSFVLESKRSTFPVNIVSSTPQCTSDPNSVNVDTDTLWLQNRLKCVFQIHNKGLRNTVNLRIESRNWTFGTIRFQLHVELKIENFRRADQIESPFQHIPPQSIIDSFAQLKKDLSYHLHEGECVQLANMFRLSQNVVMDIEKHHRPGAFLLEMLTKNSLISATNISLLEHALTEQGNEECAQLVREFRRNYPIVQASMFP